MRKTALAPRWIIAAASLLSTSVLAVSSPAWADDPVEGKAIMDGVPFVAYHEVRGEVFPDSNILNPSFTAVAMMMYRYWGGDFYEAARTRGKLPGWESSSAAGGKLADLKALVARGVPVSVSPATTPDAHRLYLVPKMCATLRDVAYDPPRPTSGALGEMVTLAAIDQLREGGCEVGLNDSVYVAARLVVGYDDERAVLVLHDPSLGPNLELGYEQFERMWAVTGAKYWAEHPETLPAIPPGRVDAVRGRTADDAAAVAVFRAYGLEVGGRYAEAEPVLREALGLEGVGAGRRHLLLLELGATLNETGRADEAIAALRAANAEFDGYWLAHRMLADLLACCGDRAGKKEARRELERAKKLCSAEAQRRVADVLGRDFHVMGCKGEMLGWHRP